MESLKNPYPKVSLLIKLFYFKEEMIDKCKEKQPNIESDNIFIKKNCLNIYKNYLKYDELISCLKSNKSKNNKIKSNKINDDNITNIIHNIAKKDLLEKIEALNLDEIINEIEKEDSKKWDYKIFKYKNGDNKSILFKLIGDFEIINNDIFLLFKNQKIDFRNILVGKCILGFDKIFIYTSNLRHIFSEIGSFVKGEFKIEYTFNENEFERSGFFFDYMRNNGINKILKNFKNKNDKIKINIGDKDIMCYKVGENNLKTEEYYTQYYSDQFDKRIKGLALLSIYKNIISHNKNVEEEVFLLNKKYFDIFDYPQIDSLINKNNSLIKLIFSESQETTKNLINSIIYELDKNTLKNINKKISKIKVNDVSFKAKQEEITLLNSKKISIYNDFILINQKHFNDYLAPNFKITLEKQNISFLTNNSKDIIKINNNKQFTIFVGNFDYANYSYQIEKILDFGKADDLNSEFKFLKNVGINQYYNERLFNDKKEGDLIFPIFSNEKIIGYSYDYSPKIKDYSQQNEYIKYINDKILIANISLYLFYEEIEEKIRESNNKNSEEFYLINQKLLTEIKIQSNYKLLKGDLETEKIKIDNLSKDKKNFNKNILSFLRACPLHIIQSYSNKKLISKDINTFMEIDFISLNYYDYKENKEIPVTTYNKFGITEKKIIELFLGREYDKGNNKLVECFFNNGYIIINLPNYLNNDFVSLLGTLDFDDSLFNLEYFMVYKDKNQRKEHIQSIIENKLDNYIKSINQKKKYSPIVMPNNKQIIGTLTKYGDIVDNDINNNVNEIKNENENNNCKYCK